MVTLDVVKFEGIIVTEHNYLVKHFNQTYADTVQEGVMVVKGQVLQAKIDIYAQIIEALQASMENK